MKRIVAPLTLMLFLSFSTSAAFSAEAGDETVSAALKEGNLYIYGAVGQKTSEPLVKEFQSLYPGIKVDFVNVTGYELFSRHMKDIAARKVSADILWSGDILLQASLVKGGYTLKYRPAEAGSLMPMANMGDTSYVTAFEPVVMVYNRKFFRKGEYPATHKLMQKEFRQEKYRGRIGTCDPEKSELAFLLLTQDLAYGFNFWSLVKSFGDAGIRLYPDFSSILSGINSGEILFGYNIPLSEVAKLPGTTDNIGWFYPADYTLALPQISMIARGATNPNAARIWTDFMLSKKGQQIISERSDLLPVREDVDGGGLKKAAKTLPNSQVLKPVGTGTEVSRFSEKGLKSGFLLKWKQLLKLVK